MAMEPDSGDTLVGISQRHQAAELYEEDVHCCGTKERSRRWFNNGDCPGIVMACFAWLGFLYGEFVVMWVVIRSMDIPVYVGIMFTILIFLTLWSHAKTMFTDPGAVPRTARPLVTSRDDEEERTVPICARCNAFKPIRSHHCRICGRCVIRMDHHCPWVNNCVGAGNQKHFLLFLVYALVASIYILILMIYHFVLCLIDTSCEDFTELTVNLVRVVLVLAFAAALFTFSMLMNQAEGIITGVGTVDKLQRGRKKGRIRGKPSDYAPIPWEDVVGGGSILLWFIPTNPHFKKRARVFGYTNVGPSQREDYEEI